MCRVQTGREPAALPLCQEEMKGAFMKPEDVMVPVYREMAQFCEDYDVVSFAALVDYASEKRPDWFKALCSPSGTRFMSRYVKYRTPRNNKK